MIHFQPPYAAAAPDPLERAALDFLRLWHEGAQHAARAALRAGLGPRDGDYAADCFAGLLADIGPQHHDDPALARLLCAAALGHDDTALMLAQGLSRGKPAEALVGSAALCGLALAGITSTPQQGGVHLH